MNEQMLGWIANALKELSRLRYGRDAQIVNREIINCIQMAERV